MSDAKNLITQTQELQQIIKNNPNPKNREEDISHIYQEIIDCINEHNHRYYNLSDPVISDQEYDELFSYLKKIEEVFPQLISSTSPTQSLQNQLEVQTEFKKAKHLFAMKSLENSYNSEDIIERTERAEKILEKSKGGGEINIEGENTSLMKREVEGDSDIACTFTIEPKFDGISIELIYED